MQRLSYTVSHPEERQFAIQPVSIPRPLTHPEQQDEFGAMQTKTSRNIAFADANRVYSVSVIVQAEPVRQSSAGRFPLRIGTAFCDLMSYSTY